MNVGHITRVFRSYQTQERIAELNRQSGLKTLQGQRDQVSISPRARELLHEQTEKTRATTPPVTRKPAAPAPEPAVEAPVESTPAPEAAPAATEEVEAAPSA